MYVPKTPEIQPVQASDSLIASFGSESWYRTKAYSNNIKAFAGYVEDTMDCTCVLL